MRLALVVRTLIAVLLAAPSLSAQARVEGNVVYGMYSGLALLMDVHHPAEPNGYGVILIRGSGWHTSPEYGAGQLKSVGVSQIFLDAGYTVFTINHRAATRFRYPAAVEDVQRAVRFVRHHAEEYGVDPNRLGGWGHSSGAHLVAMLATMDGGGDPDDRDPVNRESAKLQAAVVRAAPTDLAIDAGAVVASFLGAPPGRDNKTYREASPITYVTPDDPPLLLIHGDADRTVPFNQSELMLAALQAQDVESRLIRIAGGGHGAGDWVEATRWLNLHLMGELRANALESLMDAHSVLREGRQHARAGKISDAMETYRTARERDSRLSIVASDWNQLCWNGSLWGHAADVMAECERAVSLAPGHGGIRDSRGLARALTGDVAGAIADFEAFVTWTGGDRARAQRQDWIVALQSGKNPFTAEVLERLRN